MNVLGARIWILIGSISGFLAVALGAFAAHGLEKKLDEHALSVFKTGAQYQMYHSLALIGLGAWGARTAASAGLAGWSFTAGILLFSGSLYALAITGVRVLGVITPFGGMLFMLGWIAFAIQAWKA